MTIPESLFNSAHSYESTTVACVHGQLARQCPLCEKDAEIERLRKEVEELREMIRYLLGEE